MSLAEQIRAGSLRQGLKCSLCKWLDGLAPKERAEWEAVLADREVRHSDIVRFLKAQGVVPQQVRTSAVEHHRREHAR